MKKIAIIGGSGFVGSVLSNIFKDASKDFSIFDLDNPNNETNFIKADVECEDSLDSLNGHDCIINLAAVHKDDVKPISKYDDVNVDGARNVCRAATKNNINKIIFTSSVAIYGFAPENTDETGEANYFNDYGRTKFLAEQVYIDWLNEQPDLRSLTIIRPTVIFGENNRGNVYNLLKQIANKRFVMCGDGANIKSMAYVGNVASFIDYACSGGKGLHIFNYIDKPDMDMNALISLVRKVLFNKNNVGIRLPASVAVLIGKIFDTMSLVLNKNLPISSIRIEKFLKTTRFNSSVAKTGFVAPYSLSEALEKTIKYEFLEDNSSNRKFYTE